MRRQIHQLVAGYREGDAISNTANLMREVFRAWGLESDIFCDQGYASTGKVSITRDLSSLPSLVTPNDIAILHLSIGCRANQVFAQLNCRKVIIYHNITPPCYFELVGQSTAKMLSDGREQMAQLAGVADLNVADSQYNADELIAAGYKDVSVLPLPINLDMFNHSARNRATLSEYNDGRFNILFVGRFAPNKKLEDLVEAIYYLSRVEPNIRFIHVGSIVGMEAYHALVEAKVKALGITNVEFLKAVPQDVLNACYASAHGFLCLSEHEGFCAPLVEAMLHRVPIFALSAAAVPETLDGAGVLFDQPPDYPVIAETIAEVLHNKQLKDAIVARQDKRVQAIRDRDLSNELKALFQPLIGA